MPTISRAMLKIRYHEAAQEYLRGLPLEHFMDATPQATQRKITVESLELVHARRPEVQIFSKLLVQYPVKRRKKPGQVVPDNMVLVHGQPIDAEGSYDIPLQTASPFWVLEYVPKKNRRKDSEDSMPRYEHDLKVPYYLLFVPEEQDLTLYHHTGKKYTTVKPNEHGRLAVPELELELGLLDGWVRYWFRGELLPLPAELRRERDQVRQRLAQAEQEIARLRALLAQHGIKEPSAEPGSQEGEGQERVSS